MIALFFLIGSLSVHAQEQPNQAIPTDVIHEFYQTRDMKPLWFTGRFTSSTRQDAAMKILENSWTHGLNSDHYLNDLVFDENTNTIEKDMRLTASVLRYMNDMTSMRVASQTEDNKTKYWRAPLVPAEILAQMGRVSKPEKIIESVQPKGKLYNSLREELIFLMTSAPDPKLNVIKANKIMKFGNAYPEIPMIRERLGLSAPIDEGINLYDEALAVEVMKIQKAHGLETDGIIGKNTLDVINRTREDKIAQIIVNMERLRWMDEQRPEKYVLVNIPSATLWAVKDGETALEMPVIIGKIARPTISFKTEISGVRFNPNWTVPKTIKNDDFLPALQSDPLALTKKGISIFYDGDLVDPVSVDWTKVTTRGMSNLRIVQDSGDSNPLGKVRIIMANPFDIYLHDTNQRESFKKDDRALSSGCIRVAQPEKLADFILSANDGWTWEGMEKMISSGKMRDVPAKEKIPVYIVYQTVWLNADGKIIYGKDVYGQDKRLYNQLKNNNYIPILVTSN